ncbi:NT5C domain-containing protein [Cephalotus follicularis]|uniref:NT5C domain-containing protein n=1 Tax=Cephalotus follicularis TaxID=3775 RepID=A0A1Q3C1J2_CEPFO|nr:NT5C domain-containing protein [Cephalotus follicularis]
MLKRQKTASFLIYNFFQIPKLNQHLMSPYCYHHSCSSTAKIRTDTFFGKVFHYSPLLSNNNHRHRSRSGVGLTVKNCFESLNHKTTATAAPLVFAPHHQQLVRDFEVTLCETDSPANLANGKRDTPLNGLPDHQKFVVAVDVDEVLGNFVSALNRFIADRYSLNCSVSEYHVYEFFRIWNCSRDEADFRVHEFFKTPYFKTGIHPIPGAQNALHRLSRLYNLSVVTSRQNAIKDHTIEWIEKHYHGLFQEIHFGNHFALDGESRSKSEICRSLGAKVLIDDNPRYAIECAEAGMRVLLFDYENSYPWCKTDSINQHPLVTKVHNWEEVEELLVSWIVS